MGTRFLYFLRVQCGSEYRKIRNHRSKVVFGQFGLPLFGLHVHILFRACRLRLKPQADKPEKIYCEAYASEADDQ
jgi:hypothetical protein